MLPCQAEQGPSHSIYGALRAEGYESLQDKFSPIPGINVHEVFYSRSLANRISVRLDLPDVTPRPTEEQFIQVGRDDYLIYLRDQKQHLHGILFSGVAKAERDRIAVKFKDDFSRQSPVAKILEWVLPKSASADESPHSGACSAPVETGPLPTNQMQTFQNFSNEQELAEYLSIFKGCAGGVFDGLWSATGGMVKDFAVGGYNLIVHPIDTCTKIKAGFQSLVNLVTHFQAKMHEMGTAVSQLPLESKAQLLCSFVTSMASGALIAALTAGAATVEVLEQISSFVMRVTKLEKFFTYFSKLGNLKAVLGEKFLSALSKGQISAERLESIEAFSSQQELLGLAKQAALCGI